MSALRGVRTGPEADGNLRVDPEIRLPSPGMDVDIAYYYNSNSSYNGPFGCGRSLSVSPVAQASGSPVLVTMTHGDGTYVTYQDDGSGNYVTYSPRNLNTLVADTVDGLWKETDQAGITSAYPLDTTGQITSLSYMQDPVGNIQTFSYDSGLLANIEDAAGRLVSFSYATGLLNSIEDWAGRITTFAYDSASIPGKPLLTTITGPSACQTGYEYNSAAQLTQITDPNGYATSYAYDLSARVILRSVAGTYLTTYTYGSGLMTVASPATNIVTHLLDRRTISNQLVKADGSVTSPLAIASAKSSAART